MIGLRGYASFNLGFVATIWWALPAMHFSDIRVPYEIGVFRQQGSPPPPPSRPYMAGDSKAEHICDSNKQDPFLERLEIWVYASALGFRVQGLRFCKL